MKIIEINEKIELLNKYIPGWLRLNENNEIEWSETDFASNDDTQDYLSESYYFVYCEIMEHFPNTVVYDLDNDNDSIWCKFKINESFD